MNAESNRLDLSDQAKSLEASINSLPNYDSHKKESLVAWSQCFDDCRSLRKLFIQQSASAILPEAVQFFEANASLCLAMRHDNIALFELKRILATLVEVFYPHLPHSPQAELHISLYLMFFVAHEMHGDIVEIWRRLPPSFRMLPSTRRVLDLHVAVRTGCFVQCPPLLEDCSPRERQLFTDIMEECVEKKWMLQLYCAFKDASTQWLAQQVHASEDDIKQWLQELNVDEGTPLMERRRIVCKY